MAVGTAIGVADGEHAVHVYADDDFGAVAGYLRDAAAADCSLIVLATPEHRRAIAAALGTARGGDGTAAPAGALVLLDAEELLARVAGAGPPDRSAFDESIGTVVRAAARRGRPIRIFGELVALLWDRGDVAGAMRVEELWNELRAVVPFTLLCGYPQRAFADPAHAHRFDGVCALHSSVLSGAPLPEVAEVARRFPATTQGPRIARCYVGDVLRGWGFAGLVDDAMLVVSELATNAVIHARSDFTVGLSRRGAGVEIAVGDASFVPPRPGDVAASSLGGRGLPVVASLSRAWGHRVVDGGKLVWAELTDDGSNARASSAA
jgi:hypothetical protein